MALQIGSRVTVTATFYQNGQAPTGVIIAGVADDWTVLWDNGAATPDLLSASLLEGVIPGGGSDWLYRRVNRIGSPAELSGIVVFTANDTTVVVRSQTGFQYQAVPAELQKVD